MFGYVKAKDLQQVIDSRQYWFDRAKTVGKALSEMQAERDTLSKEVARLRKYEPVRDPVTGRWERQRQDRMMRDLAAEAGKPIGTCHG